MVDLVLKQKIDYRGPFQSIICHLPLTDQIPANEAHVARWSGCFLKVYSLEKNKIGIVKKC